MKVKDVTVKNAKTLLYINPYVYHLIKDNERFNFRVNKTDLVYKNDTLKIKLLLPVASPERENMCALELLHAMSKQEFEKDTLRIPDIKLRYDPKEDCFKKRQYVPIEIK